MDKEKRNQGVLLFALSLALLLVISARVSPGETRAADAAGIRISTGTMLVRGITGEEGQEEESAEERIFNIRELFPEASPSDWNLRLANDEYMLPATFSPNLAEVRDGEEFDRRAADALEAMLSAAEQAGYSVCVRAGYRAYQTQSYLFFARASLIAESEKLEYEDAVERTKSLVAYPGTSDHQTALAVDLMDGRNTAMTEEAAMELPVLEWLRDHCADYGFILRYPKEKLEVTGWYEPWHFRYVGQEAAEYIMDNGLCLEEFIALF